MPFKFDADGHIVLQEVNGQKLPVFVHADGKEAPFDGDGTVTTIGRLNSEAKGHREAKEAAETKLKLFEGIDDPAKAKKAMEVVANLDGKKLIEAGEKDRAIAEAIKAVEDKYAPIVKERDDLQSSLVAEKVGGSFARSKLIADKLAIPADLVQARFGDAFKVENGNVVAYDKSGNKIFSRTNPGELAGFDEALDVLIEHYPHKDQILKGSGASGGGARGNGGGGGKRTLSRAQFDGMSPADQAAAARDPNVAITD
ncbi:hypothetical protein E5S69_20555 [Cupriavidus necator]|uniref:DUF6651 domain-containing protein n=1 Tax=Cupriavidus necator TaxID=106590 RepID=UPI00148F49CD|nr:DUF6651 domain-containing protein [Cupriavidus necator]NOV25897.1 hypothetical protein [Cupriavidus necator]